MKALIIGIAVGFATLITVDSSPAHAWGGPRHADGSWYEAFSGGGGCQYTIWTGEVGWDCWAPDVGSWGAYYDGYEDCIQWDEVETTVCNEFSRGWIDHLLWP